MQTQRKEGGEYGERWLRGALSQKLGQELPRSRDPFTWYTMKTVEAQEHVPAIISDYLGRSWPANLLARNGDRGGEVPRTGSKCPPSWRRIFGD